MNLTLKKSLKGGVVLSFLTLIQFFISMLTQIILARFLMPEVFGDAALIIAIAFLFVTASSLSGDKFFLHEKENEKIHSIISIELIISLIIVATCYFVLPNILSFYSHEDKLIYIQLLLLLCFYNPLVRPRAIYEKNLQFVKARIPYFLAQIISSIIAICFAWNNLGVWSIVIWRFSALFFEVIFIFILYKFKLKLSFPSISDAKRLLSFGGPLQIAVLAVYIYGNIDYIIVSKYLDPIDLGLYWLAFQFTNQILQARKILISVASPSFVKIDNNELLESTFIHITRTLIFCYSIPLFLFYVFDNNLVTFIFGDSWSAASPIFIIFSFVTMLRASTSLLEPICIKFCKTNYLMMITLLSTVLIIIGGIFATKYYGLIGMTIAVLISTMITTVLSIILMRRLIHFPIIKTYLIPIFCVVSITLILKVVFNLSTNVANINYYLSVFIVICLYLGMIVFLEKKSIFKIYSYYRVSKRGYDYAR